MLRPNPAAGPDRDAWMTAIRTLIRAAEAAYSGNRSKNGQFRRGVATLPSRDLLPKNKRHHFSDGIYNWQDALT